MKAEVIRWGALAKRDDSAAGLRVLLDGGLVTVRSIGEEMKSAVRNTGTHRLSYFTPWGNIGNAVVNGTRFTAVITDMLGSEYNDQEERQ